MDQSEIVVSFKLGVEQARRKTADLQKTAGVPTASIRLQWIVTALYLTLGIVEVTTNHMRWTGWFYILSGCCYAFLAILLKSRVIKVPADVETRVRFGTTQIVVEDPAPQTLAWNVVEGVDRYDGALIIRFLASEIKAPLDKRFVIPKEALPDGGIALWQLFEQMLIGPLRRVSAQMSADETGALRRTDVMHIENLRARRATPMRKRLSVQSVSRS